MQRALYSRRDSRCGGRKRAGHDAEIPRRPESEEFYHLGGPPMRVSLVYPPFADATQPYASLPALGAFLRMRGNHHVSLHDANLEFCLSLWTRKRLNLASRRLEKRLSKIEANSSLPVAAAEEYVALTSACLKAPHVAIRIEDAVRDLRRW